MTLDSAHRLERRTPAMVNNGRIKMGADFDLTIFVPATVIDRSTYEDATIPSAGIPYVIVGGPVTVDGGNVPPARPRDSRPYRSRAAPAMVERSNMRCTKRPPAS